VPAAGKLRRTDGRADFIRHLVAIIDTADGIADRTCTAPWTDRPGRSSLESTLHHRDIVQTTMPLPTSPSA